jgi:hypothetical protein
MKIGQIYKKENDRYFEATLMTKKVNITPPLRRNCVKNSLNAKIHVFGLSVE